MTRELTVDRLLELKENPEILDLWIKLVQAGKKIELLTEEEVQLNRNNCSWWEIWICP